ncbi:hypothetical protein [Streptomyces sp. MNU76]|uniref:hypothetical protein n=1 Tax=Streptomyces sp. MNU76 TaxID=2560026 RepID=UPI0035A8DFC7
MTPPRRTASAVRTTCPSPPRSTTTTPSTPPGPSPATSATPTSTSPTPHWALASPPCWLTRDRQVFCLNDTISGEDELTAQQALLTDFLRAYLPVPGSFESDGAALLATEWAASGA